MARGPSSPIRIKIDGNCSYRPPGAFQTIQGPNKPQEGQHFRDEFERKTGKKYDYFNLSIFSFCLSVHGVILSLLSVADVGYDNSRLV